MKNAAPVCRITFLLVFILGVGSSRLVAAKPVSFTEIGAQFDREIRPLMKQLCLDCHSTKEQKGELDLERFAKLEDVRRDTKAWLKVAEMLDNGEMPPKDAKQLTTEQHKQLRGWIERYLHTEALASAGDPGPVVLRRLSNAEYTYTIRDLTGVDLHPAREFPADSAAGEGFTNTGNALVMSPALLTKYFDAGREIAQRVVLLPDGFRFSPSTSRSDWTNDILAKIREMYRQYSDAGGASQVNLQGIVFNTNDGGRLPVEKYLAASFEVASALDNQKADKDKAITAVAAKHGLSPKYLGILWSTLNDRKPSLLLDGVRAHWKESSRNPSKDTSAQIAAAINQWQRALWRFTSVGHIGKLNGPKGWQEPVTPLAASQEVRLKLAATPDQKDVTFYLVASDAGDGNEGDFVVWNQPRLVAPGRPELLLRDVRDFTNSMSTRRDRTFATAANALTAVDEATRAAGNFDVAALAAKHGVDVEALTAWLDYLGIGSSAVLKLDHFTATVTNVSGYDFVKGWGSHDTPLLFANSSDQHVRVPGNVKPHGVVVHPSPTLNAAVGWKSPIAGTMKISGTVTHAHPECGNGVAWSVELRRGATRQRLVNGVAQGAKPAPLGPLENVAVQPGDLVSLLIGPRDGNHACDLTDVELVLASNEEKPREWSLTRDVSSNVLERNPHADSFGNEGVWHFYTEPLNGSSTGPVIPAGSLLARWQAATDAKEKQQLAEGLQKLLTDGPPAKADEKQPDVALYRQLASLGGPLFMRAWQGTADSKLPRAAQSDDAESSYGLDANLFGKHPNGSPIDASSICVRAPKVLEVRLPADLAAGAELVATATLDRGTGAEGSVQVQALATAPSRGGLIPIAATESTASGPWTSNNHRLSHDAPILVNDGSATRQRIEKEFEEFRDVFPLALCYTKIVPVDEVVTLTLYYREDDALRRLMLNDNETRRLDRLWEELHFVSQDAPKLVDAFLQLLEYASQDADPKVFEPMRKSIYDRAAAFKQSMIDAEPKHLDSLIAFAAQAYRRPLTNDETDNLRGLYQKLREEELPHDEAFRFLMARIFVSPTFLYRREVAPDGTTAAPVSDWELSSRLSYFLWASQPDDELRVAAAAGSLHQPDVLAKQARRMLNDPRTRRLATEFACQWLHIYDFDTLDEKSEKHFPEFAELRGDMYEESILFFTDLFQHDGSVLGLLDADHTFVNDRLAKFYGITDAKETAASQNADGWRRIDHAQQFGRGGILGLSTTLAKQSGASRTSPILRGNWVSEVVLGEKMPKPPKDVPRLPEDETATDGLTVRQLVEKHTSDERCSGCHQKFDGFGFALEGYDTIGRRRDRDLANRPIDAKTKLPDGSEVDGLPGLRKYLSVTRRDAFVKQFCRKLLGYSLGRGIQLSDEPLLTEMQQQLAKNDYRVSVAIDAILQSRQFREIRGKDAQFSESQ